MMDAFELSTLKRVKLERLQPKVSGFICIYENTVSEWSGAVDSRKTGHGNCEKAYVADSKE